MRKLLLLVMTAVAGCTAPDGQEPPLSLEGTKQAGPAPIASLASLPDNPTLNDYLAVGALRNAGLRAAFYKWRASLERGAQARSLPDPMLRYGYFIREVETRVGPQRHKFGLSQTIPWPGKLVLAGQVADKHALAEHRHYEAARLTLFYEIKKNYYDYYYLKRATEVTGDNLKLVRHLEQVARTRYSANAAGHPDVIRAQVELARLEDRLKSLQMVRGAVAAMLNAALNRESATVLPWPRQAPDAARLAEPDGILLEELLKGNRDLAAKASELEAARKALRLARHNYFPNFTFNLDWIYTDELEGPMPRDEDGKDPVIIGVGVSVPLWLGKYRAAQREAHARLKQAGHELRQQENTLLARLKRVLFDIRDAERKMMLYKETLIPKGQQALGSAETSFRAGKADFMDLVEHQRVLLEFQLAYEKALSSHAQLIAELEMLVGRPVKLGETPLKAEPAKAPEKEEKRSYGDPESRAKFIPLKLGKDNAGTTENNHLTPDKEEAP